MSKMMSLRKPVQTTFRVLLWMVQRKNKPAGRPTAIHPLLRLQQTVGNQAVGRLTQTKLKVGQPGDQCEQEADRVADAVMRIPEPQVQRQVDDEEEEQLQTKPLAAQITPVAQRQVTGEEEEEEPVRAKLQATEPPVIQRQEAAAEEEEEALQTKTVSGGTANVMSGMGSHISDIGGDGQPLPGSVRAFFEPRFGFDFSQVRVHTGADASMSARAVNAQAYTLGRDIVFGSRRYAPETTAGKRLLAHELIHVVQQSGHRSELGIQRKVGFEFEMNYTAESVKPPVAGSPVRVFGDVRSKQDNFKIEMDGSRMEVTTDPFEETPQGRAALEQTMDAVVTVAKSLEAECGKKKPKPARGNPCWFEPPSSFGSTPAKSMYPLGSKSNRYRRSCTVKGVPQATLGIKLGKVDELIRNIRESRRSKRRGRTAFPLTGRFRKTGKSGRLGLTSEILFEAQDIVAESRKQELKNRKRLSSGNTVGRSNFTDSVANLLTLVVSYLRTSVMLDKRDYEVFAKAYPPIVAHSDLSKVFDQLLNDDEKEVFVELYLHSALL